VWCHSECRCWMSSDQTQACYRQAQTFKHPNIQIFKHLGVLGQTWFLIRI
jgi:hypothetical protein